METTWSEDQPIYRQLMAEIIGWILSGEFKDGDVLPSIRKVATNFDVNPLTVSKAYQELANVKLIDKRRGVGLYVRMGARKQLMNSERKKFLKEEWPEIIKRMEQVGLDPMELLSEINK